MIRCLEVWGRSGLDSRQLPVLSAAGGDFICFWIPSTTHRPLRAFEKCCMLGNGKTGDSCSTVMLFVPIGCHCEHMVVNPRGDNSGSRRPAAASTTIRFNHKRNSIGINNMIARDLDDKAGMEVLIRWLQIHQAPVWIEESQGPPLPVPCRLLFSRDVADSRHDCCLQLGTSSMSRTAGNYQ